MLARSTTRTHRQEAGIALLISIFILLLISVVAIALVVSSGTESALAGNYRSATGVYYAALSGLEEARGRLRSKNSEAFTTTNASGFLPAPGTALAVGATYYLINPVGGEPITPWDSSSTYADNQFGVEFGPSGFAAPTNPSPTALSVWNRNPLLALNLPGPLYKWVRINAVSEKSAGIDADNDNLADSTAPLYYDGAHFSNNPSAGPQVLELTSFAMLPNGSQKILQYLVAPTQLNLNLPAAVTIDGNTPKFTAPTSPSFWVHGNDQGSVGTCNPTPTPFIAVGYTNGPLSNFLQPTNPTGVPAGLQNHYTNGVVASNPDIVNVTLSPNLQTVAGLNSLVQTITQNADVVVNHNATQADLPASMSATNPMTIAVNGDLVLSGWHGTGYGLLLITGDMTNTSTPAFTYDPDASWDGIVLVIGKGWIYSHQGAFAATQILGALLLAKTVDTSNNPLPSSSPPGSSYFDFSYSPATNPYGIGYSSCWIQAAMPVLPYKVLSFHEIASQ
jgi:hypothetical protein